MACFDNEFDGNPRIFPCVAQASACEASMAATLLVLCAEHCLIAAFSLAETALVIGGPKLSVLCNVSTSKQFAAPHCSVNTSPWSVNRTPLCSVNTTSPCSVNTKPPCSVNTKPPCSVNATPPCSVNTTPPCSVNTTPPCSVNTSPCSVNTTSSEARTQHLAA